MCARQLPNEGRKVHSYCINSSLSFLSRAHLNQQKAPAGWCPLARTHSASFPLARPCTPALLVKLKPSSSREYPKSRPLVFRATLEPAQSGMGVAAPSAPFEPVSPYIPYGGLAANDSCYSFATQFSLQPSLSYRLPVGPREELPPRFHRSLFLCVRASSFRWFSPVDY